MEITITNEWLETNFGKDYQEFTRTSDDDGWQDNLEELWHEIYTKIVEDWLYRDMTAEESNILETWLDNK